MKRYFLVAWQGQFRNGSVVIGNMNYEISDGHYLNCKASIDDIISANPNVVTSSIIFLNIVEMSETDSKKWHEV